MFIKEHCRAKRSLNIPAFCIKIVMSLSCCNNHLLLFKNLLNIDQQHFRLVFTVLSQIFCVKVAKHEKA